jgi:hypothetical protein
MPVLKKYFSLLGRHLVLLFDRAREGDCPPRDACEDVDSVQLCPRLKCLLPKFLLDNSAIWRYPEVAKTYKIDRV